MEKSHPILDLTNEAIERLSTFFSRLKTNGKSWLSSFVKRNKDNLITLAWLTIVAILIFGYTLICYNFTIPLSGDGYLQSQTMPYQMYDQWHRFFNTGHFSLWDSSTGLGVNTIGADSFYGLFSPFTLITLIFPRSWIPQEIAILYIVKIVSGGFFFYLYLRMFNISVGSRRIGGVAFAFCGWVTYYLWFAFYLDAFAFFPLILYGIEKVIQERDPRLLIVAFFLVGLSNYFFLAVFMIGACLYSIFRYIQCWKQMKTSETRWAVFGMGVTCFLLGILLSAFVLLPSIMNVKSMPRINESSYLDDLMNAFKSNDLNKIFKVLFQFDYSSEYISYRKIYPLNSLVFMNLASFSNNLLQVSYYDNLSGSSYIFVPLLLMTFVGYLYAFKKKRIGTIIGGFFTIFFMSVPFFYYLFSAFTVGYARFYLLPISWMIAFACKTIDERREISRGYLDASMAILVILQITAYVLSIWAINNQYILYKDGYPFADETWWERLLILPFQFGIDIVGYVVMRHFFHGKKFNKATLLLVSIEAIAMGNTVILNHGFGDISNLEYSNGQGNRIVSNETNLINKLKEYDSSIYRVFNSTVDRNNTNLGLVVGHDSLSAFNSNYAFNAQDFIDWSNLGYTSGNWSMGEHNRRSNVETFLGVKYYMVRHGNEDGTKKDNNIPWGYVNIQDINPNTVDEAERTSLVALQDSLKAQQSDGTLARDIYLNNDYINLGFAFDTVLNSSAMYEYNNTDANEYAYLRYAIMDEDDLKDEDLVADLNKHLISISKTNSSSSFQTSTTLKMTFTPTIYGYSGNIKYFNNDYDVEFIKKNDKYVNDKYNLSFTIRDANHIVFNGFNLTDKAIIYTKSNNVLTASTNTSMLQRLGNLSYTVYASHWDENGNYITGLDPNDTTKIDHYIYPADTKIDMDNLKGNSLKGLKYYTKVVIEKKDGSLFAPQAGEDNPVYLSTNTPDHYEWHFVDEDGNDVTSGEECYSKYQKAHGFYVRKPVKRIIGYLFENKDDNTSISKPYIYQSSYADYKLAIDKLKAEPINVEYRRGDRVRFTTNYSKGKVVVLNIPRENGWKLKKWDYPTDSNSKTSDDSENKKEKGWQTVTTYKTQGGFVGFIADKGETLYQLDFETPGLSIGSKATMIGIVFTCFFYVCYNGRGLDKLMDEERRLRQTTYEKN